MRCLACSVESCLVDAWRAGNGSPDLQARCLHVLRIGNADIYNWRLESMDELPRRELEIMLVLWERGPTPVRGLVEAVYGRHTQSLHTTVKSLLDRLIRKGLVSCSRDGPVHTFTALVDKEVFVRSQVDKLAEDVFHGNMASVMLSMVDQMRLTKKDKATIEEILRKLR